MAPYEEACRMLVAAERDLRALSGMTDPDVFVDEIFGFHAQQAAEKTLKAWLSLIDVDYPKTHDLSSIIDLLESRGCAVKSKDQLLRLNVYAVQYRYEVLDEVSKALDRSSVEDYLGALFKAVQFEIDFRAPR